MIFIILNISLCIEAGRNKGRVISQ